MFTLSCKPGYDLHLLPSETNECYVIFVQIFTHLLQVSKYIVHHLLCNNYCSSTQFDSS